MVPETHKRLVRATAGLCIEAVNAAIGESDGHIEFKQFATRDRLNTTVMRPKVWEDGLAVTRHNARCVAGDTYCKERGIEKIDLLKIDVEGAEQSVLRGFQSLLRDQKIRLIQFEYGYANGDERFLMRDFFEFFDGLGYKVARLRRRDIEFTPYRREYNNFTSGPNFIAIRNGDPELELALTS